MELGRCRSLIVALVPFVVAACAASPGVRQLAPQSDVRPEALVRRTPLRMIRIVKTDSSRVTLYGPHIEGEVLVGIRDAGPPVHVPLDSVARVAAYLAEPPAVSKGEWARLGGFVVWIVVLSACAVELCASFVGGS